MTTITGIDLPIGSPGGSVELLKDLYLGPGRLIPADVFMLTSPHTNGRRAPEPKLLDVPSKQLNGRGFWEYVSTLTDAIKQRFPGRDYSVVHLQHLAFGATPALLRAFPHHRHMAIVHGTDLIFAADHPTQAEVLREAANSAERIVVPTAAMADSLRLMASVRTEQIVHIPWGVPDHLLASPPARRKRDDADFRLLYAGRLTAEKGVAQLIKTLAGLTGVTFSIAAPATEYQALAQHVDMSEVRYLGWYSREELWRVFDDHDLLIIPSNRLEAFCLVAVEAQACGLPVAYQPVPGLIEVLGDSAISVDLAASPDAFATVVGDLAQDSAAQNDLRSAGHRNALRYPLSRTAADLEALSG